MRHFVSCAGSCALVIVFATIARSQPAQWTTIKGQVVFPAKKPIPERKALNVTQDKKHCLMNGPILDESILINAKNRGVKNVVVYLRPDNTDPKSEFPKDKIHPNDAKRKPAEVVIDQPCCMFVKRITVARVGDTIVVKNPAPVVHNFFWTSDKNGDYNPNLAAKTDWKMPKPLVKEPGPIKYTCTVHPWMTGYVRIFDHPYSAVTDEDGKFEIKNAPAGKFRIVYWHENGVRGGAKGRFGDQIDIQGDTLDLKTIEFDVAK
ncbi:MAG: hypothetical protein L0241_26420 [Planctomycetia bacterium]|nr:hypothetical protein [Planctomycetia bacterium]